MKRFFRSLCLAGCAMLLFAGCTKEHTTKLKIVCTADVHGNFFPYDFCADSTSSGSLARVSSFLKEQRAVYGSNLLYVDVGDILQGSLLPNREEFA